MKLYLKSFGLAALLSWGAGTAALPQSLVQRIDEFSSVDWTTFVVRSSGSSSQLTGDSKPAERIEALEQAKEEAEKNLLKAVGKLLLDSNSTILQAVQNQQVSIENLQQAVRRFTIVDTRSMSDMSIEVDVELPVTDGLASLLFPKTMGDGQLRLSAEPHCPTCGQLWPDGKTVPERVKLIVPTEGFTTGDGTPFTALIVDARGLDLRPSIMPKVLNENDQEVYGAGYAIRAVAMNKGLVEYRSNLNATLQNDGVGSEPLIVRGLRAAGGFNSDIIVSNNDALLIHAAAKSSNFLKECKVVLIVDSDRL